MNEAQFTRYLFQGLGRPHCYFEGRNDFPFRDALRHACLYNPVYHKQLDSCDYCRTTYYSELIEITDSFTYIRQSVLDVLSAPDEAMDVDQLLQFALGYARTGDATARQLLYERSAEYASIGDISEAEELVDLEDPVLCVVSNSLIG